MVRPSPPTADGGPAEAATPDPRGLSPRTALVVVLSIAAALITLGAVSALVGGDAITKPLQFFAHDWRRIAWQLGIPLVLIAARRRWAAPLGLSITAVPRGVRSLLWAGPAVFGIVLTLNLAHGRYSSYDTTLPQVLLSSSYYFVVNALSEELFFRGLVQSLVIHFVRNRAVGVVLASLIFGLYHIPMFGWGLFDAIMPAVGGLVFGFAFIRTRSIVTPWFLHGLADLALLNDTIGTFVLNRLFP